MRLPPYGRDVAHNPVNVFVYAGINAWTSGRSRAKHAGKNTVMVLPSGEGFHLYSWPVRGVELMLIWPDGSLPEVKSFGEFLVRSGATLVVAPHPEDPEGCLFIKPIQRIAA